MHYTHIPIQRYHGSVAAFGVYGRPTLAGIRVSKRTALLIGLAGLVAALYVAGVLDGQGLLFAAGPLAAVENEKVRTMRTRRGQIIADQRTILDAHPDRLAAEDEERYDKLTAEDERLERAIALEERDAILSQPNPTEPPPTLPEPRSDSDEPPTPSQKRTATPEYARAWDGFLRNGVTRGLITVEQRATSDGLQADGDTAGGFYVPPQRFVDRLIKFVDDAVVILQRATVDRVDDAASLGIPSLDADPEDGDWTQELTTVDFDTQMEFGKRELRPHELTKGIKVSRKLMRLRPDVEGLVVQRLGYKLAVTQEKAFLTGNGVNRPLGIFTASSDGISTGRDTTAAATTSWTADNLMDTLYSVKEQYQRSGVWVLHRLSLRNTRKLKDGNGQYLWQAGLSGGQPSTILDRPYVASEFAPSTFTTGLYVAAYGDLSFYQIADAEDVSIQRLVELYAATNQIGFIGRAASDGMPVLEEAFARLILA